MDTKKVVAVIALLAVLSSVAFVTVDSTDSSASGGVTSGTGSGEGITVNYFASSTGSSMYATIVISNVPFGNMKIVIGEQTIDTPAASSTTVKLTPPLADGNHAVLVTDRLGNKVAECNLVVETKYIVTLSPGEGTGTPEPQEPATTYTFEDPSAFTAPSGKVFDAWSVNGEKKAVGSVITLDSDITATALWKDAPHVTGVTLNQTIAKIVVGAKVSLTATVAPSDAVNKNVTWASNSSAVSISWDKVNATVTGVSEGTATITVTTEDGNKTATCTVTVTAAPTPPTPPTPTVIPVTGVTLDKATAAMDVGETETLRATVSPSNATDKTVTWKSSNESVATVSANGVVTALKAGTTTITVTTNDGNKTATCAVTVTAAPGPTVPVTGVILDKETATAEVGKTVTLTATVSPSNATNKAVTWRSSDSSVATVSANGVVTAIKEGTATITVTTSDGGKVDTCVMTVTEPEPQPENGDGDDNTLLYIVIAIIVVIVVIGVVVYFVKFR